jgi:hypothetical protein
VFTCNETRQFATKPTQRASHKPEPFFLDSLCLLAYDEMVATAI